MKVNKNGLHEENEEGYCCFRYITSTKSNKDDHTLEPRDSSLLLSDAVTLLKEYIPQYWELKFKAQAVVLVRRHKGINPRLPSSDEEMFDIHYNMECK